MKQLVMWLISDYWAIGHVTELKWTWRNTFVKIWKCNDIGLRIQHWTWNVYIMYRGGVTFQTFDVLQILRHELLFSYTLVGNIMGGLIWFFSGQRTIFITVQEFTDSVCGPPADDHHYYLISSYHKLKRLIKILISIKLNKCKQF